MLPYPHMDHPHSSGVRAEPKHAWTVIAIAVLLTGLFHGMVYGYVMGLPAASAAIAIVIAVHVLVRMSGRKGNGWAYLFLLPLAASMVTQVTYAGSSAVAISFLTGVASLALFSFWFGSPKTSLRAPRAFINARFLLDSVFPFGRLSGLFTPLMRPGAHWRRAMLGALGAVPFLVIFAILFVDSDLLLKKTLADAFSGDWLENLIRRGFADLVAFLFLLGAGWRLLGRIWTEPVQEAHPEEHPKYDHITISVFLLLLNLLFLAFLAFQSFALFGGMEYVQAQGITYAEYARSGFFQLLLVALAVFGIIIALYRSHNLRDRLTGFAASALIVQTGIICVSAVRRLLLYMDAYGLTLPRFWAMVIIALTGLALLTLLVTLLARIRFVQVAKGLVGGTLLAIACVNLVNVEAFIVRVNGGRLHDEGAAIRPYADELDMYYLFRLSSDAIPELVRLQERQPSQRLLDHLVSREEGLRHDIGDWRGLVISDYRALAALADVKSGE